LGFLSRTKFVFVYFNFFAANFDWDAIFVILVGSSICAHNPPGGYLCTWSKNDVISSVRKHYCVL